jgi:hypothetical protein
MKTLTATDLKTRTGDFFDALLADGEVLLTRNGREYPVKLATKAAAPVRKMSLREALYDPATGDRDFEIPPRSAISRTIDLGSADD